MKYYISLLPAASRLHTLYLVLAVCCSSFCACSNTSSGNQVNPASADSDADSENAGSRVSGSGLIKGAAELAALQKALSTYDAQLYSSARETFAKLQSSFPSSYFAPLYEIKIADCAYAVGDYEAAIESYKEFEKLRPKHEAIPYTRLQIANANFNQYKGVLRDQTPLNTALEQYELIAKEFPDSAYALTARSLAKKCEAQFAAHEAYVANFYYKHGQESASVQRTVSLLKKHGEESTRDLVNQRLLTLAMLESNPSLGSSDGFYLSSFFLGSKSPFENLFASEKLVFRELAATSLTTRRARLRRNSQNPNTVKITSAKCISKGSKKQLSLGFSSEPSVEVLQERRLYKMLVSFEHENLEEIEQTVLEELAQCETRMKAIGNDSHLSAKNLVLSMEIDSETNISHQILDGPHRLIAFQAPN